MDSFRLSIGLPSLRGRGYAHAVEEDRVPFMYCFSQHLVPSPADWGPHIDITGAHSVRRLPQTVCELLCMTAVWSWVADACFLSLRVCHYREVTGLIIPPRLGLIDCALRKHAGLGLSCLGFFPEARRCNPPLLQRCMDTEQPALIVRFPLCSMSLYVNLEYAGGGRAGFCFLDVAQRMGFEPPAELRDFLAAGPPPVYFGWGSLIVDDPKVCP